MSTHYEAPQEVRELEKLVTNFAYRNGLNAKDVFRDFLLYTVKQFSCPGSPALSDWQYTEEQEKSFYEMFITWIRIMDDQIKKHDYYDALGDLFMVITSEKDQQFRGQFFTPGCIAEIAQRLIMDDDPEIPAIYDPAVGSGRMIIHLKAEHPRSYLVGWDIDYTCCLMSVCNFLINSCVGEVVCIDSLGMDNFRGAWLVNEAYYRTGLPGVRWMNKNEYILYKQKQIPPYVFFLDQKRYDEYFRIRETWAKIMALFNNTSDDSGPWPEKTGNLSESTQIL